MNLHLLLLVLVFLEYVLLELCLLLSDLRVVTSRGKWSGIPRVVWQNLHIPIAVTMVVAHLHLHLFVSTKSTKGIELSIDIVIESCPFSILLYLC